MVNPTDATNDAVRAVLDSIEAEIRDRMNNAAETAAKIHENVESNRRFALALDENNPERASILRAIEDARPTIATWNARVDSLASVLHYVENFDAE